jgi:lysophospholipase L1-like esterase
MHFRNVYWDAVLMRTDDRYPSILAIGDSWFWYPFPGGSLLNHLGDIVAPREHVILAFGNNGAEAFQYVHGTYAWQIKNALDLYGSSLSAVFISGGGNDFAGLADLRPLLRDNCSGCTSAAECFRDNADKGSLGWLFAKVKDSYIALIDQVIGATWQTAILRADGRPSSATGATQIILHNYDYALPTGIGIFGRPATWLRPAFEAAGVAPTLRDGCMRILIDNFTTMLGEVAGRYAGRVVLVDSRDTLGPADWANELHPTPDGFEKIARRWHPVLHVRGLA